MNMKLENVKVGQKVRVIGDSLEQDPHELPLGTVVVVEKIVEPVKFEDFPPLVKLVHAMVGNEPFDLPHRVHVKTDKAPLGYANIVLEDIEPVVEVGDYITVLTDDHLGGFKKGETFEVYRNEFGRLIFFDNDGDERLVDAVPYE